MHLSMSSWRGEEGRWGIGQGFDWSLRSRGRAFELSLPLWVYSLAQSAKLKELKREWKEGQYLSKLRNGRFVLELLNFCRMVYKRLFRIKLRWNVKLRCSIPVREICRLYWFQENLLLLVEKYQISARTVKVKTITIQLICPKLNVQRNEDIAYPGVYRNFSINIIRYLLVTYCYSSAVVALP